MPTDIELLQKQLADAKSENEKLAAALKESDSKQLAQAKAEVEDLKRQRDVAVDGAAKFAEGNKATLVILDETKAALAAAEEATKAAQDELALIKAEQKQLVRLATAKEKLKMSDARATKFVTTSISLTDEQFAEQVEDLATAMTEWVTNNPQAGNTAFPHGTAKEPPKVTPAPLPDKKTPAPLPPKLASKAADVAALDSAVVQAEAALAVETDAGAESVRLSIAKHFGYQDGESR